MSFDYPAAPPPPQQPPPEAQVAETQPKALKPVLVLLMVNLALSIGLTIAVLIARHSVIEYQLDHEHITDPDRRDTLRTSYTISLWARVGGNLIVTVVYAFLVRALLRGRRWAYRRVILIGAIGIVGLLLIQATPYPVWMRVEQIVQALTLAALLYFVLRPEVRAHYAKGLPGRDVRRFRRN